MQILHNDVLDQSVSVRTALSTFKKVLTWIVVLAGIYSWYAVSVFINKHDIAVIEIKPTPVIVKEVKLVEIPPQIIEVPKIVEKVIIKEVKVPAPAEQKTQLKLDYNLTQPKVEAPAPQPAPPVVEAPKPAPAPVVEAPKPAPPRYVLGANEVHGMIKDLSGKENSSNNECLYQLDNGKTISLDLKSHCLPEVIVNLQDKTWRFVR